jgi:hypothetical protein
VRPTGEDVQIGFVEERTLVALPEGDGMPSWTPGEDDSPF